MELFQCHNLSQERLEELKCKAIDWALANGISMRPTTLDTDQDKVVHAPFALFPTPIPSYIIQQATQSMVHFNTLMHKAATDHDFLKDVFEKIIEVDAFTQKLWEIYVATKSSQNKVVSMGIFRNDFLIDSVNTINNNPCIKQVEFNTIAAGLGAIGTKMSSFYRYILDCAGVHYQEHQLPENNPVCGLASCFIKAWDLYGNKSAVILFLVSPNEMNTMDQRLLEHEIYRQNRHIKIRRKTFNNLVDCGKLANSGEFLIGTEEVAIVYYRVGYSPRDYTSEQIWSCRLKLEQSKCIKCPPIHYQLVGAKKIQQVLAVPEVLEKFVPDNKIRNLIRCTFAGQYTLDMGPDGDTNLDMAIKSPDSFVLKPQREGGGNNVYGKEMAALLNTMKHSTQRSSYILMDRIKSEQTFNYIIKPGAALRRSTCVSELGIYGCYIGLNQEELYNKESGYLLRTKLSEFNEGGMMAGFGGIDLPFIINKHT